MLLTLMYGCVWQLLLNQHDVDDGLTVNSKHMPKSAAICWVHMQQRPPPARCASCCTCNESEQAEDAQTLLHMYGALSRRQHFSAWNGVMAAVLKVWRRIGNQTPSVDTTTIIQNFSQIRFEKTEPWAFLWNNVMATILKVWRNQKSRSVVNPCVGSEEPSCRISVLSDLKRRSRRLLFEEHRPTTTITTTTTTIKTTTTRWVSDMRSVPDLQIKQGFTSASSWIRSC